MNELAALLGGGAAPAAPLPSSPAPGPDPLAAALMGGPAFPADPMAAMAGGDPMMGGAVVPAAPAFPSADPNAVGTILEQLLMAQQADHAALQQAQTAALIGNPLFEALVSGAPLGPGAGQDAQAIGMTGDVAPADTGMPV